MYDAQDEIAQLKLEVEQLRKALGERQQLSAPNPPSLRDNYEFVVDLARFSEGLFTEAAVRKKYHFDESTWESLGKDDALVERIEAEKVRRVRDGSFKREKAQQLIVKGPAILDSIATSSKSDKHKIEAVKALDSLTGNPAEAEQQDRIIIKIDMGADLRAKNLESNPADVLVIDTVVQPKPNNVESIDSWDAPKQLELNQEEPVPPKRGPGRPPGSKNKPKPLPGFITE